MHKARKRFGQHFLHDHHIVERILQAITLTSDDIVIEIGPGQGALTDGLVESNARIIAIELDRDLMAVLHTRFARADNLTLINADALKVDYCQLTETTTKRRVVGNLPYNISTPLLFHLLRFKDCIRDMCFMLQKEVVDRICAAPGGKDYGRLSVMMQYHFTVEKLFTVKPGAFQPPPKVDSAVLRMVPYQHPPVKLNNPERLEALVGKAFGNRRKTLRNNLKGWLDSDSISGLGIDPERRAETLTLAEFAALVNSLPTLPEQ